MGAVLCHGQRVFIALELLDGLVALLIPKPISPAFEMSLLRKPDSLPGKVLELKNKHKGHAHHLAMAYF